MLVGTGDMKMFGVRTMAALLVLAAISSGCASSAGRPAPFPQQLDDEVDQQLAANEALPWSASRRLIWDDFRGSAPGTGAEGALTAYSLFYGIRCTGQHFQFRVVAAFLPHGSWVKPLVLADPQKRASTLQHEQTHFDLAEVYARRMRRRFAQFYNPCGTSRDSLDEIAARYVKDEAAAQARYDDETRHGLTAARQRQWDEDVRKMLAEADGG